MSEAPPQQAAPAGRQLATLGTWVVGTAIMILSVAPAASRPVVATHNIEHVAAFVAFGVLLGTATARRYVVPALGLIAFCCLVEFVQLWVPGRHARFEDLLVDVLGGFAGLALAALGSALARQGG